MFYEDGKAFDTTKAIDAAITLTAKAKEFKVTFDSGVEAITVKYNETAKEPAAPTKEGFDFVGWYEGETEFYFATKITKDISLTAKWEEKKADAEETPVENTGAPVGKKFIDIALTKNESGKNNQGIVEWIAGSNEFTPKTGDKVVVEFTATADSEPTAGDGILKGFMVDNSSAANYWKELSSYVSSEKKISTNATDYSFTFELKADSTGSTADACKFGFYFQDMQDTTVKLSISKMKVTYNKEEILNYEVTEGEATTIVDVSSWTQNLDGYCAADAEVATVNDVQYIKATTKADWNNMIYVSGTDLSAYSKLIFDVFATVETPKDGLKLGIEFIENTEGWPVIGSAEIELPQADPVRKSVIFDLSGTQWNKFDMIKVFVKDADNTLYVSDVYISSIQAE